MGYLEEFKGFDDYVLTLMNGSLSLFWDGVILVMTSTQIWIPLAVVLFYVLLKNNSPRMFFLTLLAVALTILLCDQISSGICKPFFERFRPTNDPMKMFTIDIVNGYRGGRYGFVSSHAANTFGLCVFLSLLFKRKAFTFSILLWAILNSYSRIYLGVHYPSDVCCGALIGSLIGYLVYLCYKMISHRWVKKRGWISVLYTKSGYLVSDINIFLTCLFLLYSLIPIIGIIVVGDKLICCE